MRDKLLKVIGFTALFTLGSAGVLFILPSFWLKLFFALFFFGTIIWIVRSREYIDINTLALITAYVLSVAQFGLHFYFRTPGWLVLITSSLWVGAIFWWGLQLVTGRTSGSLKSLSLISGLAGAEISMALLFWPTHFLVTGTVFFLVFYLAWMTAYFYMSGLLNWHRMMVHTVFVVLVLSLVLFTAQWQI
jgi:hypothetical protein